MKFSSLIKTRWSVFFERAEKGKGMMFLLIRSEQTTEIAYFLNHFEHLLKWQPFSEGFIKMVSNQSRCESHHFRPATKSIMRYDWDLKLHDDTINVLRSKTGRNKVESIQSKTLKSCNLHNLLLNTSSPVQYIYFFFSNKIGFISFHFLFLFFLFESK